MILGRSSKPRSRASIACAGCRARRTKCIIADGCLSCERCTRLKRTCVLRDDDERKRPVTKAQVNALIQRIGSLEQRLSDAGLDLPPVPEGAPLPKPSDKAVEATDGYMEAQDDGMNSTDLSMDFAQEDEAAASTDNGNAPILDGAPPTLDHAPPALENLAEAAAGVWPPSISSISLMPSIPPMPPVEAAPHAEYAELQTRGNGSVSTGFGEAANETAMDHTDSPQTTPATSIFASDPVLPPAVHPGSFSPEHRPVGSMRGPGGHSRFVGITTNYHMYSNMHHAEKDEVRLECEKTAARTRKFLANIPYEAHHHLIYQFWNCYNSIIHIVHRGAFETDSGDPIFGAGLPGLGGPESGSYYTPFLHVCMLAVGFRYADRTRPEIQAFATPQGESLLHDEAKLLAELELKMPGGVPSVQALLLMGDLECGVGRYNTGWMYAGMACRLVFDLGLNRQCGQQLGQSRLDMEVKRTVLYASIVFDRNWGLFLGRPTSIKYADISMSNGPDKPRPMDGCLPMGLECRFETEIFESLIGLANIASKLTDAAHRHYTTSDASSFNFVAAVECEMRDWYRQLPRHLQWTPGNLTRNPPSAFFNLHQQYHTLFILLYRPFLLVGEAPPPGTHSTGGGTIESRDTYNDDADDTRTENTDDFDDEAGSGQMITHLARKTCFSHAIEIARIYEAFCTRFPCRSMFVTGMQHAATAAFAIVDGLEAKAVKLTDKAKLTDTLLHLQRLAESLHAHASVYYPARVMTEVLFRVIAGYRESHQPEQSEQSERQITPRWHGVPAMQTQAHSYLAAPTYHHQTPAEWAGLIASSEAANPFKTMAPAVSTADFIGFDFNSNIWDSIMSTLSQPVAFGV